MQKWITYVESLVEEGKKSIEKSVSTVGTAFAGAVGFGLAVSAVVAPLPTLLAAYVLWEINRSIQENNRAIEKKYANRKKRKKIAEKLKGFGKLPANAVVETECLKMHIDIKKGSIEGRIFDTDKEEWRELGACSDKELGRIRKQKCFDRDAAALLDEYLTFRRLAS